MHKTFLRRILNIHNVRVCIYQVDRASTFKIIGREGGIGVPLPESGDVPDDHNVHLLEIQVPGGESLGISLVPTPSTNQRDNIFQVNRIKPLFPSKNFFAFFYNFFNNEIFLFFILKLAL